MDTVTVAELKAKLSHYLREVYAGRSFVVLKRDVPVAELRPVTAEEMGLRITPAARPRRPLSEYRVAGFPRLQRDILAYLDEEREDRV